MHSEPPSNSAPFRVLNFCHAMASANKSNGYEDVASVFIHGAVGTVQVSGIIVLAVPDVAWWWNSSRPRMRDQAYQFRKF